MTIALAFLFVLGVLICVHELGHFLMARRIGVRVLTFSLGFGPKLFTIRRGGTDYCLSVFPLGGYVKLAGEKRPFRTFWNDHAVGLTPLEIPVFRPTKWISRSGTVI